MNSAQTILTRIEATVRSLPEDSGIDPCTLSWVAQLRNILDEELPEMTEMTLGTVYRFSGKRGLECRAVVTKENPKTWVLYETTDSSRPGARWMINKNWCLKENIERDSYQTYSLPSDVRLK